jgi:hypothetical protein
MADDDDDRNRALLGAADGLQETRSRLEELQEGRQTDKDNIVRFLRQIPADDMRKKEELAKYFQTPDGQRYSREERKSAYDDLLGENRNRRTHG